MQDQLQQAASLIKQGKKHQAQTLLRQIVQSAPDDPRGWWLMANAAENATQARLALEQVLRLAPNNKKAQAMLEKLKPREGSPYTAPSRTAEMEGGVNMRLAIPIVIIGVVIVFSLAVMSGFGLFSGNAQLELPLAPGNPQSFPEDAVFALEEHLQELGIVEGYFIEDAQRAPEPGAYGVQVWCLHTTDMEYFDADANYHALERFLVIQSADTGNWSAMPMLETDAPWLEVGCNPITES